MDAESIKLYLEYATMAMRANSVPAILESNKDYFETHNLKTAKQVFDYISLNWYALGLSAQPTSLGQIPNVLKTWGWANNARSETVKTGKTETVITTMSFSADFKDAMQHLHIVGYMPFQPGYVSVDTQDGNAVSVNEQTRAWLYAQLNAEPLNATFMFAVRNCKESDWRLAKLETPSMRQARMNQEKIESDKLDSALKLVESKGFKLVKPESCALFAQFQASENYILAEQCTMASMQALENLLESESEKARLQRIQAYLVKKEKLVFDASLATQVKATAENQAIDADARITEAMAQANQALLERDAANKKAAETEALLAKMQAQIDALMKATVQAQTQQGKPQGKRINNTQANASA